MKLVLHRLFIICSLLASVKGYSQLTYQGKSFFLHGANIPWHYCGADVGTHYQWGPLYNGAWWDSTFTACENNKVNCVRLWLHADGRATPEFDVMGSVSGLDTNFFSNLDDLLNSANQHNLLVILSLWSFEMTGDLTSGAGQYAGLHANLISDSSKTRTYINNALIPMVKRYANQCNLLAFEIINEPEWSMVVNGGGNTVQTVTAKEMQRFVGMQAEAIHKNSKKMVTVGSACLKWNSNKYSSTTPTEGNYWSNTAIQSAYNKPLAYLDFYQIHYYDYMSNKYLLDPFNKSYPFSYWQLDKPTIIGECPAQSKIYSNKTLLANALKNKFSGVLFWSYGAGDGIGSFSDFKSDISNFSDSLLGAYLFSCPTITFVSDAIPSTDSFYIYPNPAHEKLIVKPADNVQGVYSLSIIDISGKVVCDKTFSSTETVELNMREYKSGIYFIRLMYENNTVIQKLVIQ